MAGTHCSRLAHLAVSGGVTWTGFAAAVWVMERLRGSALSFSLWDQHPLLMGTEEEQNRKQNQARAMLGPATWLKPISSCGKANSAPRVGGAGEWEELEEWEELGSGRRWKGVEGEEWKPRPKYVARTSSVPDSVLFASGSHCLLDTECGPLIHTFRKYLLSACQPALWNQHPGVLEKHLST